MKLIIAEKTSVAKSFASALGTTSRADGFYEGNGLIVSWCVVHLVSPMDAASYDEHFKKWRYDDLPILPEPFRYVLIPDKEDAYHNLCTLMNRLNVDSIVNACDAGREGELNFRLVYGMTGCTKLVERLWISSMEDTAILEGFLITCVPAANTMPSTIVLCAARKQTGWWISMPPVCSPFCTTAPPECGPCPDTHPGNAGGA